MLILLQVALDQNSHGRGLFGQRRCEDEAVSELERADRLTGERPITVEDIRALAGPSTPHFSLQVRNRIAQMIEGLPEGDPVRVEGEKQIERLTQLAEFTGDPRSGTGAGH